MGQRLEQWHGGDGERRWLSLLSRPWKTRRARKFVRRPCEGAVLQGMPCATGAAGSRLRPRYSIARH